MYILYVMYANNCVQTTTYAKPARSEYIASLNNANIWSNRPKRFEPNNNLVIKYAQWAFTNKNSLKCQHIPCSSTIVLDATKRLFTLNALQAKINFIPFMIRLNYIYNLQKKLKMYFYSSFTAFLKMYTVKWTFRPLH